jgi:hypothetical protein
MQAAQRPKRLVHPEVKKRVRDWAVTAKDPETEERIDACARRAQLIAKN